MTYILDNWMAIAALSISVILLYREHLKAFRLEVRTAGRVSISKNPFSGMLKEACLLLDLSFLNQGARRGVVEDVAVHVSRDKGLALFRSYAVVQNRTLNFTKEPPPPVLESFAGFELTRGESVVKRIMFLPYFGSEDFEFEQVSYTADVWVKSTDQSDWKRQESVRFTVDSGDMTTLAKMTPVPEEGGGYYLKWLTRDKVVDEAKEQLEVLKKKLYPGR